MENNWYCNKCHNENFKVTMSNCDCPICGSSDIERISYEEPKILYSLEEIKNYLNCQTDLNGAINNLMDINIKIANIPDDNINYSEEEDDIELIYRMFSTNSDKKF